VEKQSPPLTFFLTVKKRVYNPRQLRGAGVGMELPVKPQLVALSTIKESLESGLRSRAMGIELLMADGCSPESFAIDSET
jgi:hypothetical protein